MSDGESAVFRAELHKMAASIGAMLETCKREGQISCGCHLVIVREDLHKALHAFNPRIDERDLKLNLDDISSSPNTR